METTAANVHDVTVVPDLMEGTEENFHGDSGYTGVEKREDTILTNKDGNPIQIYRLCASLISEKALLRQGLRGCGRGRTREVICSLQSGACLCGRQGHVSIPKNSIAGLAKGGCTNPYALRSGEPCSGCAAFRCSLIAVRFGRCAQLRLAFFPARFSNLVLCGVALDSVYMRLC